MFRELEALALVVRRDAGAVELVWHLVHLLVDKAAHDLAVFEDEGRLVTANFEHAA